MLVNKKITSFIVIVFAYLIGSFLERNILRYSRPG